MRRAVAVVLLLLGCGAPEPAPAPAPAAASAPELADPAPASPEVAQPTFDERRRAEVLAERIVASFDQAEQAFAGGTFDDTPLLPVVGGDVRGASWALSGQRMFEALPESRSWSTVVEMVGGPPDSSFTLGTQRLEVGIYRTPGEGASPGRRAGLVFFRVLRDELVLQATRDGVATQHVYEIATAGVFLPDARTDELLRPQPTADERRDAEALAERFAAAFDQVEQAFARGETDNAPLVAVRGEGNGPVWAMSGTDLIETPRRPGQPESVVWCAVVGFLGGTPDVSFALEEHRLEVGVYRADAAGPFVREAGIVLVRVMKQGARRPTASPTPTARSV